LTLTDIAQVLSPTSSTTRSYLMQVGFSLVRHLQLFLQLSKQRRLGWCSVLVKCFSFLGVYVCSKHSKRRYTQNLFNITCHRHVDTTHNRTLSSRV